MTRLAYFLSLLLAGTTTACDDLIPIPQHECGNGVTEAGEACDGEPNCEPAGAVHACRYGCDTDIDCPQASTACSDEQGNCEAKWQCACGVWSKFAGWQCHACGKQWEKPYTQDRRQRPRSAGPPVRHRGAPDPPVDKGGVGGCASRFRRPPGCYLLKYRQI